MTEIEEKLSIVRKNLEAAGATAARFRGVDWFAWITGGANSAVIMTTETGIADVLITATGAFVLTNEIEKPRLQEEEISGSFEIIALPWSTPSALDRVATDLAGGPVMSDRPANGELPFPAPLVAEKRKMRGEEVDRYRTLGRDAAEAMTEALQLALPDWTENQLAGEGAKALWKRGIHPTLVLVAGARRGELHRHPFPTAEKIGPRAMMVFCGRRKGLYANLTRFISFGKPSDQHRERMNAVAAIESRAFELSKPGTRLSKMYEEIVASYREFGLAEQTEKQHFGGTTGYLSREVFARPLGEEDAVLETGTPLAWNPTLPGAKIEDTVLLTDSGVEILTRDPAWPDRLINGLRRPDIMVK